MKRTIQLLRAVWNYQPSTKTHRQIWGPAVLYLLVIYFAQFPIGTDSIVILIFYGAFGFGVACIIGAGTRRFFGD